MKKITLKISAFLLLVMFGSQVDAQPILWTENGTYKIGARGTNLFMTINGGTGALEWQTELPGDDPTQVWAIVDHRSPASTGLMEITSQAGGLDWTMCIASDAGYPNVTITVEQRLPKVVSAGDWSGLDQFQRRKAKVDANGDPDSGGSNPATGNNALFIQAPAGTNSRYGVIPTAAGDPVEFNGGGIDVIDYHFIAALSTEAFDASSIFIANPVKNELSVKGLTSNISQVAIYSLLGQEVLSRKLNGESSLNLDISALTSGMYIVDFKGENGSLTKKIVKQ
ncbi:T9SS type A sorting domain-containing protein [Seonamhaeicola maritimus]|uniref:T9SS type A sorting domain-containing protein n=1 Tax=Seonamhaeicola maritimus TaxID=2591822 RepID=A0A5C7GMG8_9FLAO|nr:T9SS type A sorting domain-containing protein [Seonamhaeicola maritimus]TXG39533.1 T9SS type A sorting domain-containing protein [Seonamhaeicola maritimus]